MKYSDSIIILLLLICLPSFGQENKEDAITFSNGDVQLSGTLSTPAGKGPFPVILLVSGSGPQTRDSEVFGFRIFKIMADYLNAHGIAVLRYDDRGTGESGGTTPMMVTSEELAGDAAAGIELLKKDKRFNDIGMLGHSEGGIIVPMIATKDDDIDFVILLAGYGVPGRELVKVQQEAIMKAQGLDQGFISASIDTNDKVISLMDKDLDTKTLTDSIQQLVLKLVDEMPESMSANIVDRNAFAESQANNVLQQFSSPWMRYFLKYDPAPTLSKLHCPVLLLFGGKDTQVLASQNKDIMVNILKQNGNKAVVVHEYPDANHLFQKANTGSPMEYSGLEKKFVPELLPDITEWIKSVTNE